MPFLPTLSEMTVPYIKKLSVIRDIPNIFAAIRKSCSSVQKVFSNSPTLLATSHINCSFNEPEPNFVER